ncbi:MAG: DUF2997 domain-containing protein [Fibrobacterales bacterium]|nr:DUF2997 domain-containing protein [Fibrobacterales bacterium]
MKEYRVEIEIDDEGNITADTKGFHGPVCEKTLDELLEGIEGRKEDKKKPEYFAKEQNANVGNLKNRTHS